MPLEKGAPVAIVDDDRHEADITSELVAEAGLRPEVIEGPFSEPQELVHVVRDRAAAAVIDHRLQPRDFAKFDGATAAALLFDARVPSVLVTQFVMDIDASIRKWRFKIPVLLTRDEASGPRISAGFDLCQREFSGQYSNERQPRRSLIRIESVTDESGFRVADAVIPGWNAGLAVRFPIDLIPLELRDRAVEGARFFADVNIGSRRDEDLYLTAFELAVEPETDDGLA